MAGFRRGRIGAPVKAPILGFAKGAAEGRGGGQKKKPGGSPVDDEIAQEYAMSSGEHAPQSAEPGMGVTAPGPSDQSAVARLIAPGGYGATRPSAGWPEDAGRAVRSEFLAKALAPAEGTAWKAGEQPPPPALTRTGDAEEERKRIADRLSGLFGTGGRGSLGYMGY